MSSTVLNNTYLYNTSTAKGRTATARSQQAAKQEEYAKKVAEFKDQYINGVTNITAGAGTYTSTGTLSAGTIKALKTAYGSSANQQIMDLLNTQKTNSKPLSASSMMSDFLKTSQGAWW